MLKNFLTKMRSNKRLPCFESNLLHGCSLPAKYGDKTAFLRDRTHTRTRKCALTRALHLRLLQASDCARTCAWKIKRTPNHLLSPDPSAAIARCRRRGRRTRPGWAGATPPKLTKSRTDAIETDRQTRGACGRACECGLARARRRGGGAWRAGQRQAWRPPPPAWGVGAELRGASASPR
jgi:hypothetical protein